MKNLDTDSYKFDAGMFTFSGGLEDKDGNQIENTPFTNPYNYDTYVVCRGGSNNEITGCVYSDRLYQFNPVKYNKLRMKYFNDISQMWYNSDSKLIESFLRDYMDDLSLNLILIEQGCNASNGFPFWVFSYKTST